MKILNIGSLNLDYVYSVDHFVAPGETWPARGLDLHLGGKGFNQSIAMARAGLSVVHFGAVGSDGDALKIALQKENIDLTYLETVDTRSGHAIIQVVPQGQNSILIYGGANLCLSAFALEEALRHVEPGAVIIQNETNLVQEAIACAKKRGIPIVYNPAPLLPETCQFDLSAVDILIVNALEADLLCGAQPPEQQLKALRERCSEKTLCVLTQGAQGVWVLTTDGAMMHFPAEYVPAVVDTTAAGDTFIGFFVGAYYSGQSVEQAIQSGIRAASICITRAGACASIPYGHELGNTPKVF